LVRSSFSWKVSAPTPGRVVGVVFIAVMAAGLLAVVVAWVLLRRYDR
jgi:hypothetical protein